MQPPCGLFQNLRIRDWRLQRGLHRLQLLLHLSQLRPVLNNARGRQIIRQVVPMQTKRFRIEDLILQRPFDHRSIAFQRVFLGNQVNHFRHTICPAIPIFRRYQSNVVH